MNRAMKSAIMIKEGALVLGGHVTTKNLINMRVTKNMMNMRATKGVGKMRTLVRGGNKLNAPTTTTIVTKTQTPTMKMQGETRLESTTATHCCCRHGYVALALGPNHISSHNQPMRLTFAVTYGNHMQQVYNCLGGIILLTSN